MPTDHDQLLPPHVREWLLALARRSIVEALAESPQEDLPLRPTQAEVARACFVSLHTHAGELRGCIGTFVDTTPLFRNVEAMAVAAATRDPRFAPMSFDELGACVIEISALTARVPLAPGEVVVGEHGLWIEQGGRAGVLLPQVAVSHGWDRETFLRETCAKAGLPREAWRDAGTSIEAFTAEVFGEVAPC